MAKLVDILARELEVWPDNNLSDAAASFVAQDSDGMIVTLDPEETASASQFNRTEWSRGHWTGGDLLFEVADDHQAAIITHAQWQAAVDALKAQSPTLHLQQVGRITRVPSWVGSQDELPPAGTICEYKHVHEWQRVEVFAVKPNHNGSETALFTYENGTWCGCAEPSFFRPIRTPEQIAAEERETELNRMVATVSMLDKGWARKVCAGLYDAGYRKLEITDDSDPA